MGASGSESCELAVKPGLWSHLRLDLEGGRGEDRCQARSCGCWQLQSLVTRGSPQDCLMTWQLASPRAGDPREETPGIPRMEARDFITYACKMSHLHILFIRSGS